MIENDTQTHIPNQVLHKIDDRIIKKFYDEISNLLKKFGEDNNIMFHNFNTRITRQGTGLALHISGETRKVMNAIKNAGNATREAARFIQKNKLLGIDQVILNREVKINGVDGTFKVIGMKGRKNDIVLQNSKTR